MSVHTSILEAAKLIKLMLNTVYGGFYCLKNSNNIKFTHFSGVITKIISRFIAKSSCKTFEACQIQQDALCLDIEILKLKPLYLNPIDQFMYGFNQIN